MNNVWGYLVYVATLLSGGWYVSDYLGGQDISTVSDDGLYSNNGFNQCCVAPSLVEYTAAMHSNSLYCNTYCSDLDAVYGMLDDLAYVVYYVENTKKHSYLTYRLMTRLCSGKMTHTTPTIHDTSYIVTISPSNNSSQKLTVNL